jgi:hypothetical protein
MPGGKVHRGPSVGRTVADLKKRRKRPCASLPKTPTNVAVAFVKKEVHHREVWRARVTFDGVTVDVAERPLTVERYQAQLRYTNASGVPITIGGASDDVRRGSIAADETPLKIIFERLSRPKSWYVQARVRTLNRVRGARCWSAWSAWTTAAQPTTGTLAGPPAPSGLVLTFDKVEGTRGRTWRAKGRITQSGQWTPTDGDPVDIEHYVFQLQVSSQSDGTPLLNTRRGRVVEHDPDETYARQEWHSKILGKRYYRIRARARALGRPGAWTSWTTWASPGGAPNPVQNLTWSNPTPALLVAKWDDPADPSDVNRYAITVIKTPATPVTVDTGFTASNRWTYHIPKADRGLVHRVRVKVQEDLGSLDVDEEAPTGWDTPDESTQVETTDASTAQQWGEAELENDAVTETKRSPFKICRIRTTTNRTLGTGNDVYIRCGTEDKDTLGAHPSTTDADSSVPDSTYDLTLPSVGFYTISARITFDAHGTGRRDVFLDIGPGTTFERYNLVKEPVATIPWRSFGFWDVETTSTNTIIRLGAFQSSGGNLAVTEFRVFITYLGR